MNSVEADRKITQKEQIKKSRIERVRRPLAVGGLTVAILAFLLWLPPEQRGEIGRAMLAQRGLMISILLFTLVSLSFVWARGQTIDNAVFLYINLWGFRPKWLDALMWVITQFGGGWFAILLAISLWATMQNSLALEIILGTLTLGLIVEGLKELMNRARPYLINTQARVIGWKAPGRSFPSGHTSQAFFLTALLSFQWGVPPLLKLSFYVLAVFVGITRMYVGAHFPRDVVAGAILGTAWGTFLILIDPYWHSWFGFQP
jgi:membrane-associated phospholipid phosphatase